MNRAQENRDDKVSLVEMGPRDGLQNEAATLSLVQRMELIARLAESGLQRIEVGAFVSPKKVPQMADSAALFDALPRKVATRYGALVPNLQGLQAAIAARADEIGLFTACSDGFTRANIGISVEESLVRFAPWCRRHAASASRCAATSPPSSPARSTARPGPSGSPPWLSDCWIWAATRYPSATP